MGRVLVEKSLAQSIGTPTLTSVSHVIDTKKKSYYEAFENVNRSLDITAWIEYFSDVIVEAQQITLNKLNFILKKDSFLRAHSTRMNHRQLKTVLRMFEENCKGFDGGLSANNYCTIAKVSQSTTTRDLADLSEKGILHKTETLKGIRYWLNFK